MQNERIQRRRARRRRIRKIKLKIGKNRLRVIMILFFIVCLCSIISVFSTQSGDAVYNNEAEFIEYADEQLKEMDVFSFDDDKVISYEYGNPVSYAVEYEVCDNKNITEFRERKTDELKSLFAESKAAETSEQNADDENNKQTLSALMISSAVFESSKGVTGLAIYEKSGFEADASMCFESSNVYTYQFSSETGRPLVPEQIFTENYRDVCSEYFKEYFLKTYINDELNEDWEKYVTNNEENFTEFIITEEGVVFFFDEGTVVDKTKGIIQVGMSYTELEDTIREKLLPRYIYPDKPMIALTYDDGPGGEAEERILKCLENNGVVATFFYMGSRVQQGESLIKKAHSIGCELGNHTWSHPYLPSLDIKQVKKEIRRTNKAVKDACGAEPTVFRPSYGESTDKINKLSGMPVIMWSIDTLDWESRNAKKIVKSVTKEKNLDGKIILMHSLYDATAEATEKLIPILQEKGYQFVTVSELLKYRENEIPENGKVYR